jgi:uncharacterized RDD family membrane protein YckC
MNFPVRPHRAPVPVAPLFDRFWAWLVDGAAVTVGFLVLVGLHIALRAVLEEGAWDWLWRHPWPGQALVNVLYEAGFLIAWGTTPGKQTAGLVVADHRTGNRLSPVQAVVRTAVMFGPGLVPGAGWWLGFVVLLPLLWDGIGLYDRAAGTVVTWRQAPSADA